MPSFQLYDLKNDIGETTNVIEDHMDVFVKLKAILKKRVLEGRSTPGKPQPNEGDVIWDTVRWMEDF